MILSMKINQKGGDLCFNRQFQTFVENGEGGESSSRDSSDCAEKRHFSPPSPNNEHYGISFGMIETILSYNKNLMRRIYGRGSQGNREKEADMA